MPINTEGAYESYSFMYQHETDTSFVLKVEYHHTEMGPTITLHNLLDSGPLDLPLSAYVDIVDHLRSRGSIPGGTSGVKGTAGVARPAAGRLQPTRVVAPSGVQRPQMGSPKEPPAVEAVYAPQHAVLTADGAVDPFAGQRKQEKTAQAKKPVEAEEIDLTPDPTKEIEGDMSLAAGKSRRAAGHGHRSLKPNGRAKNAPGDADPEVQIE